MAKGDGQSDVALRWVKNDHLGFQVPYRKDGVRRRYLPDFIVELANGQRLMVEIKGQTGDAEVKAAAAHRWCNAVNNDGRFGHWSYHLVKQPPDLLKLLGTDLVQKPRHSPIRTLHGPLHHHHRTPIAPLT